MQIGEIAVITLTVLVLAGLGWMYYKHYRRSRLRAHFGPEYERMVSELRDRGRAESILSRWKDHLGQREIRPLASLDKERFHKEWKLCQSHFVDDPGRAVDEADRLVTDIIRTRGYATEDMEERFGNISAAYPGVANGYREACNIVARYRHGNDASTEDLRRAMVCYRELVGELLESEGVELEQAS